MTNQIESENNLEKLKIIPDNIVILGQINKDTITDYPKVMYTYQRLINNLIGAVGIIKSPENFFPYVNRDTEGNIYINSQDKNLTAIDIKTVNIADIWEKINTFINTIQDKANKQKLQEYTKQIQHIILDYFTEQRKDEVESSRRHSIDPNFDYQTYTDRENSDKRIMESLYNLVGPDRMRFFDYDPYTNTCTINQKGKERLLQELYKEIDAINTYRFSSVDDIFPGADYPNIKNKSITAPDIDTEDIIYVTKYLLAAHHSIDDMAEIYRELDQSHNTKIKIYEPLRKLLKKGVKMAIKRFSTSNKMTPIIDDQSCKAKASKLKTNRGILIERIAIANRHLNKLYDFDTIHQVYLQVIEPLKSKLENTFPGMIQFIKIREKSDFSRKNKILRTKEINEFGDMLGIQIFIDSSKKEKAKHIQNIFAFINDYIHNKSIQIKDEQNNEIIKTIKLQEIQIDNKGIIEHQEYDKIIQALNNQEEYHYSERKKKKHKPKSAIITKQKNMTEQEYINTFFSIGKTGGNGKRQDIKTISTYKVDDNTRTSGIESQILLYGESVNQNEGAHPFLDAQKTIDGYINTNAVCPREQYVQIKESAITSRAEELVKIRKKLKRQEKNPIEKKQTEYTKEMFEKERFYIIPIDEKNREYIAKTNKYRNNNIIRIKKGEVIISLLDLVELSGSISKRHAADLIIMSQINKELQSGKYMQYYYHSDLQEEEHTYNYIIDRQNSIIHDTYPRITDIGRNEKGSIVNKGIHLINPSSKIRIQTGQTPQNGYVFIPDEKGEKAYIQKIDELAYALKIENITEDPRCKDLIQILTRN